MENAKENGYSGGVENAAGADAVPDRAAIQGGDFLRAIGMDAEKWGDAFVQLVKDRPDADTMRAWFANAIMVGYDHGRIAATGEVLAHDPRFTECRVCGATDDLRFGVCFDCADAAESRALKRNVFQHVAHGIGHAVRGHWFEMRTDFSWAWERMTRTGDYAPPRAPVALNGPNPDAFVRPASATQGEE